jgi:hypothetical protein
VFICFGVVFRNCGCGWGCYYRARNTTALGFVPASVGCGWDCRYIPGETDGFARTKNRAKSSRKPSQAHYLTFINRGMTQWSSESLSQFRQGSFNSGPRTSLLRLSFRHDQKLRVRAWVESFRERVVHTSAIVPALPVH